MTHEVVTLESVSEKIDYGLTASATQKNTGTKFLRITDIQDGVVNWNAVPYCDCSEPDAEQFALEKGDILFARTGSVGKSYLVNALPSSVVFASYLIRVRLNCEIVHPPFLAYYFRSQDYWRQITETAVGGIQLGVNATKLGELRVPVMPLPEQRRIAAILDRADRLRRTRRYAQQLSETFLQAVFVRMFGDVVQNNSRWELDELQELCDEIYRYPTFYGFAYASVGVPIVRIGNILANGSLNPELASYVFITPEISHKFPRTILELYDIVMAVRGDGSTVERIGIVDSVDLIGANISPNLIRFKPNSSLIHPLYLFQLMVSGPGQQLLGRYITRTAKKTITATDIKEIRIPVPPLALQQKFARIVQQYERLRAKRHEAERQAEHLFQTLLHRAFSGAM